MSSKKRLMMACINTLSKVTGNRIIQRLLENNVLVSQYLMGIGAGSNVACSGEEVVFKMLKRRLDPPYCVFDVGANKGQFLRLLMDNITIDDISVHCFEPGLQTFKTLVLSSRGDKRVKMNNIGLSGKTGEAILHYDSPGSGLASLSNRRLDHFGIGFEGTETVVIDTIDNYSMKNAIDRIHLLKIDIEGHELDALSGAKRMFDNRSVDIVMFEFGGCNIDCRTYFQDFWYFFKNVDMKIYRVTPSGYLSLIESYKEIQEQFRTTNFIAISNRD